MKLCRTQSYILPRSIASSAPLPHHCFSTEQIQQQTRVQIKAGTALLILAKASERKMYGTAENQPNLGLEKIMQRYENVFRSSFSSQL